MGSGESKNKTSSFDSLKPNQPVSARELLDAISELTKTVSLLNKAVVQLQGSLRARTTNKNATDKNSYAEKDEVTNPPKTIH